MNYFLSSLLLGAGILSSPFSPESTETSSLDKKIENKTIEEKAQPKLILEISETEDPDYVEAILWIENTTSDTLTLAPCSDGTFVGWIEPTVSFSGWGLVRGKWMGLQPRPISRCGNHDSMWWSKEMIQLPPGEKTRIGARWMEPKSFFMYRDQVERVKISATYSLGKTNPEKVSEYNLSPMEIHSNAETIDIGY